MPTLPAISVTVWSVVWRRRAAWESLRRDQYSAGVHPSSFRNNRHSPETEYPNLPATSPVERGRWYSSSRYRRTSASRGDAPGRSSPTESSSFRIGKRAAYQSQASSAAARASSSAPASLSLSLGSSTGNRRRSSKGTPSSVTSRKTHRARITPVSGSTWWVMVCRRLEGAIKQPPVPVSYTGESSIWIP